ncbi:MAG: ammonium transporter [Desulfatibacillaceae bacterium]
MKASLKTIASKKVLITAVLALVVLLTASPAVPGEDEPGPAAVAKALSTIPEELLGGKTQAEIEAELPISGAYRDEISPVAQEVTVEVGGVQSTVTIFRYLDRIEILQYRGDVLWTCIAAFLVFIMQAGFACVEAGFTRAKNAVNIMMKNIMDFSIGTMAFLVIGFHLMFSGGESLFFLGDTAATQWGFPFWIFQCVFAATAATIVSGGMAERTKFTGYLCYSVIICAFIYPIFGSWAWGSLLDGSGWLENRGFYDFAGSTVVHSIGGWLALAGAITLGARKGKYTAEGKPRAIPGHSIPLAVLGGFLLWLGWFGFNPGSTTTFDGNLARIAVMTNIAAASGAIGALIAIWSITKKPDAAMTVNGFLAGLVAICSPVDAVSAGGALVIGLVAGVLVVVSVIVIDRYLKVDDPVGAVSVHGVCGAWGTLSYAFFGVESFSGGVLMAQILGIVVAFAWAFGTGLILFNAIKFTVGLRVSEEEEYTGLDHSEHGMEAYAGFQFSAQ